jgi:hypothetical protein
MEYKDSFNYDESDEQQRKRQQHNPNDPYGLGASSPGDPYGLSSAPIDDPYSLQPLEAPPDLGPKAKKKEPTDSNAKKDKAQPNPSKADASKPEDTSESLFGMPATELEKHVGKSTDPQETQADALAKQVAAEPASNAQNPAKAEPPASTNQSAAPNLPGLPTTGGKKLSQEDQQKFGKKVGDLSDVEIHNAPKHAKFLEAEAFTVGRRIYTKRNTSKDTLDHEIAHFNPNDKASRKLRRKSSSDGWAERERQKRIAAEQAEARRKEKERIAAEAKRIEIAKAAAARRVAAAKAAAIQKEAELRALGRFDPITGRSFTQKKDLSALEEKVKKQQAIKAAERKANPKPPLRRPQPLTGRKDLSALEEKVRLGQAQKAAAKQAKLQKTLEHYPGIQNVLKQPFFKNALASGALLAGSAFGASAIAGAELLDKNQKQNAFGFGKAVLKGASKAGAKILKTGETSGKAIAQSIPQSVFSLANPAQLATSLAAGAVKFATAPPKAQEQMVNGAVKQGENLWKGAQEWGGKAQKFTEAIPGWIDTHVDQLTKGRAAITNAAVKKLEHIPVVGKAAQAYAWFDNKMGEFGGGVLKGAGSMVGGVANIVTHPVETAKGLYSMAEHVPVMGGLVPNPLKLLHAGTDIIFNGADPKTRLETVMDPAKSLEDDKKFGKALVEGFIEPYKKSWSEGKYFEVAGRATFDVGSLFIGAGEANAAIKGGAAASKATEVANVASRAGKAAEVANVASKTGKAAEVASTAGKTAEVANVVGKTGKVAEVTSTTGKTAEVANVAGKTAEVANVTGKTEKAAEVASTTGKATEVTSDASRTAKAAKSEARASKTGEDAAKTGKGKTHGEQTVNPKSSIGNKGYDKSKTFRSDADPLHDTYGPAQKSHPEEFNNTIRELEDAGVEVDFRPGNLGYSPAKNNPGRFIFDPEASVGALRHEMRHFKDIRDAGYPGIGPYLENPSLFWKMEYRGYMEEVNFARQNRDFSNARKILDIMRTRKKELLGEL